MTHRTLEQLERERAWRQKCATSSWGQVLEARDRARKRTLSEGREKARKLLVAGDERLRSLSAWDQLIFWSVVDLGEAATTGAIVAKLRRQGHKSLTEKALLVALRRLKERGLLADKMETRQGYKHEYQARVWRSLREIR